MHANRIFNRLDLAIPPHLMHVKVVDLAQTIATELEAVYQHAHVVLARVQHVFPAVHWVAVAIGHNHL